MGAVEASPLLGDVWPGPISCDWHGSGHSVLPARTGDCRPGHQCPDARSGHAYDGSLELRRLDVHDLDYPDGTFDQVFTSCTFCSVPDPVGGLKAVRRVLKQGGTLGMFEHTRSRLFPFGVLLEMMTLLTRRFGPEMNRDTVTNVARAGFTNVRVEPVYLDVVKIIRAVGPG